MFYEVLINSSNILIQFRLLVQWHPRNNMLTLLIRCCKPERVVSSELRCRPCPWESVSTTTTTRLKCEPCPCPLTLSNTEFRTNELLELWANIRGYPFTRISALPERNLIMRRIWNYIGQWMGLSASINGLHISDKWDQWGTIVKLEKGFGNQD